jgi:tetratricopeptide (TPR) repeat protein
VRVLFSPAQGTTAEQDQEQARALLERLRQSLGDAWQDDWLSRGLPAVPRPLLPLALREGLEAALRKMQEAAAAQLPAEVREVLEELARSGVEIRTAEDLQRALENPDLREKLERPPSVSRPLAAALLPNYAHSWKKSRASVVRPRCRARWNCANERWVWSSAKTIQCYGGRYKANWPMRSSRTRLAIAPRIWKRPSIHYQQALEVYTRQAYPEDWAMTQNNLGNAYRNRIRGERAENLEQAIFHYRQALEVYTRQAYPEQWARTQNNLGNAYRNRIRGERAENLEQAIFHYQQALDVYTRQAYPEQWAMTQNNLGNAYLERIRGERAENLEQAIFHYQQALEVYTRQAYPEQWAMPRKTTWGTPTETAFGGSGRRIWSRRFSTTSRRWKCIPARPTRKIGPATQNNLGNAYLERIRGERAENLEQAIFHYRQALEVYTRQAYPEQWATTQNNLGNCLC